MTAASKAPYRFCWHCNRQFQGKYYRELVTATGSHFVHAACVDEARKGIDVVEVRRP